MLCVAALQERDDRAANSRERGDDRHDQNGDVHDGTLLVVVTVDRIGSV